MHSSGIAAQVAQLSATVPTIFSTSDPGLFAGSPLTFDQAKAVYQEFNRPELFPDPTKEDISKWIKTHKTLTNLKFTAVQEASPHYNPKTGLADGGRVIDWSKGKPAEAVVDAYLAARGKGFDPPDARQGAKLPDPTPHPGGMDYPAVVHERISRCSQGVRPLDWGR